MYSTVLLSILGQFFCFLYKYDHILQKITIVKLLVLDKFSLYYFSQSFHIVQISDCIKLDKY